MIGGLLLYICGVFLSMILIADLEYLEKIKKKGLRKTTILCLGSWISVIILLIYKKTSVLFTEVLFFKNL